MNPENYSQRNVKSTRSVLAWSFLWGFSLVLACVALKFWWPQNNLVLTVSVVIHLICALGALKAHQIWLKGLDELQQQIQLRSMALALGLAWIGIVLLLFLVSIKVLEIREIHLIILIVVMAIAGALGNLIGMRKTS